MAQDEAFRRQSAVLSSPQGLFSGLELTLFARLNSFQPFVRISSYGKAEGLTAGAGADIKGLTGWRSFFGVEQAMIDVQYERNCGFDNHLIDERRIDGPEMTC